MNIINYNFLDFVSLDFNFIFLSYLKRDRHNTFIGQLPCLKIKQEKNMNERKWLGKLDPNQACLYLQKEETLFLSVIMGISYFINS